MAFLGLTDIKFKEIEKRNRPSYNSTNSLSYPLNIGSTEVGHYVVFYINEFGEPTGNQKTTAQRNAEILGASGKNNLSIVSNASKLLTGVGKTFKTEAQMVAEGFEGYEVPKVTTGEKVLDAVSSSAKKILNSSQRYRRTTNTIALYMPNTLQFDYRQRYNDTSATEAMGKIGFLAQAGSTLYETGLNDNTLRNMKSFIGEAGIGALKKTGLVGNDLGNIISQAAFDTAINPQVELLYSHPELRSFQFAFNFFPNSRKEAETIDEIIRLFKHSAAPALQASSSGRYFTPPGSFDIEFMYNGKMNKNIPKISTCILENIQVNYSPGGSFSALELNPGEYSSGKGDGMPSQITLQIDFRETEIITREMLDNNFANDGNSF